MTEAPLIPLTRHRGPRVAFAGSAIVITAVTGRLLSEGPHAHGLPSDGNLAVWRSTDDGRTWAAGPLINDVPAAATEGLHSLAANQKGHLVAVWLDKRTGHGTELYSSKSTDQGRSWSKNTLVYQSPEGTICECCHPSAAMGEDGEVAIMWRNWLAGSRDMYLARSRDGTLFSKAEKLGSGTWKLNACPMDGGALALVRGQPLAAWRREGNLFLSEPGAEETFIGTGKDIALAANSTHTYAIWSTPEGIAFFADGKKRLLSQGAFPVVAINEDGAAITVWEENAGLRVSIFKANEAK